MSTVFLVARGMPKLRQGSIHDVLANGFVYTSLLNAYNLASPGNA